MGYLLAAWEIKQDRLEKFRAAVQERLMQHACKHLAYDIHEIKIRGLLARDFGLSNWQIRDFQANTPIIWINNRTNNTSIIALYKVTVLSENPKISTMQIELGAGGATTLGIHELDGLYSVIPIINKISEIKEDGWLETQFGKLEDIRMEAYFTEPYICFPDYIIRIKLTAIEDSPKEWLKLEGFVAEPIGRAFA